MGARVLIVDDHAGFRASATRLLECEGFEVVGEAADGAQALSEAERTRPDLILLDVYLPDGDGRELAGPLGEHGAQVLLISSRDDVEPTAGTIGFIAKDRLSGEAITALLR